VIECFFGGERARLLAEDGPAAGFAYALDQLSSLFGSKIRSGLRPLVGSCWSRMASVGGAYSYALPGQVMRARSLRNPSNKSCSLRARPPARVISPRPMVRTTAHPGPPTKQSPRSLANEKKGGPKSAPCEPQW
jgi:hypothetical protein